MGLFRNKGAEVHFASPNTPIAKLQEVDETDEIFPEDFQINFCQKIQNYQDELGEFKKKLNIVVNNNRTKPIIKNMTGFTHPLQANHDQIIKLKDKNNINGQLFMKICKIESYIQDKTPSMIKKSFQERLKLNQISQQEKNIIEEIKTHQKGM